MPRQGCKPHEVCCRCSRPDARGSGALTYPLHLLHPYIGYMVFKALNPQVNAHLLSGA